ncbi:hypothetical protein BDQ12DRAFT_482502 [Crucibulum laeve]|uniref:U1-type domain-containing protein n=1 Tax=Crucibulum laeve TaxID=68775 RepID=A0A5C3M6R7_9AGAR|nr:hypothetical protein BDQ12DRAFT_482502 [Crucibulum laeve]
MADVRALLKAKRQEARISHPLATYSNTGQLKCLVCNTLVKHASAWEGHLGSKIHRTNVARLKEEERIREEQRMKEQEELQEREAKGKRKADEDVGSDDSDTKKRRLDEGEGGDRPNDFPSDFFTDPSRMLAVLSDDDEEEGRVDSKTAVAAQPTSAVDLEFELFQREFMNIPDAQETYARATVAAEPKLASETPEGFPAAEVEDTPEVEAKLTEDERRKLKAQEERELIMDRLLDEERAQEEADMKVALMKTKLEGLKRKREAAKLAKAAAGG